MAASLTDVCVLTDVSGFLGVILYLHSLVVSPGFIRDCTQTPRACKTSFLLLDICVVWRELSHFRQFSHLPFTFQQLCLLLCLLCVHVASDRPGMDGEPLSMAIYYLISLLHYWLILDPLLTPIRTATSGQQMSLDFSHLSPN